MSKKWKEGVERSVALPEVTIESFDAYLGWVYKEEIVIRKPIEIHGTRDAQLTRAWVLADQFGDVLLRNAVIDKFVKIFKSTWHYPDAAETTLFRNNTVPGCTLRRLMLQCHMSYPCPKYIKEHRAEFPEDFLAELTVALLEKSVGGGGKAEYPWELGFHEHNERFPACE